MLEIMQTWLSRLGLAGLGVWATRLVLFALVLLLAWLAHVVTRLTLLRALRRIAMTTRARWDDVLVEHRVFDRLAQLAPALVIYLSATTLFPADEDLLMRTALERLATVWMVVVIAAALAALFDSIATVARDAPATRDKPVRSYVQVAKILLWLTAAILVFAAILAKSPWALLGGLGALTAVLMLVFRDSILGFVASIQIASYDLVRVGEWIEVPRFGADGEVIDLSLHTVRIQNWDKTIVTVPTTALMTDGFKNWRGMNESGGRRIKRSLALDMGSVRFLSEDELSALGNAQVLRPYLERKRDEIQQWNQRIDENDPLGRRRLTNVGTFRAYVEAYLRNQPLIDDRMTFLVRQLAPGPEGLPIEIYAFSKEQRWAFYEGLMADIFDHLLAQLPRFGLRVFQNPTGSDLRDGAQAVAAALEAGRAVRVGAQAEG